ncbi:MAG: NAD(P)-dependent oxidoreductase [Oscillospiraceae bacterium]|nr:NAD(P)-dependent oxidoreductase [Oscillospiraceae bacterium]
MKKIALIGTGVMGQGMARNLMKNGFELTVFNRTKAKADPLVAEGAEWADTIADCVAEAEAVITIVGYPRDVEEVYLSDEGIIANAPEGCYLIDMTTTDPRLSEQIAEEAAGAGMHALDAPVSGGDKGAREGTLAIMVGGEEADFEACLPLFRAMGKNIRLMGGPGAGQHTKMANQIAIAGTIAGVCEAITYAGANGLNLRQVLDAIGTGAAGSWQMNNMAPRMLEADFEPGFYIRHFIKDLKLALEGAEDADISIPVTETVLDFYQTLEEEGHGDEGTQALIKYYCQ